VTIIKVSHKKDFTVLSNQAVRDSRLSLKARGLHHLLLSYPDNWEINIAHLSSSQISEKDGRSSIASALNELEACGYLVRERTRDDRGRLNGWKQVIQELPAVADENQQRNEELGDLKIQPDQGLEQSQGLLMKSEKPKIGKTENRKNRKSEKPKSEKPKIGKSDLIINTSNDQEILREINTSPLPPNWGAQERGGLFGFQIKTEERIPPGPGLDSSDSLDAPTRDLSLPERSGLLAKKSSHDPPRHPALTYDPDQPGDTPWLEKPTRREIRVGSARWNRAFLEWGGKLYSDKFGKSNLFQAIGDFRISLENEPQKILSRWEEYEAGMGAAFQNVVDRQAAGVPIDDRDRQKFDLHRRALEGQQFDLPQPRPALEAIAQTAQERRIESIDWGAIADQNAQAEKDYLADLDVQLGVDVCPVRESIEEQEAQGSSADILASQREYMARMSQLTRTVRMKASVPQADTRSLLEQAIESGDRILLNDPSVKSQLQQKADSGLLQLVLDGVGSIVRVVEPDF
jgi:hypothetical protein